MSHCTTSGIKTGRKLLFFQGFRRDVREFLGSILALFRPSGPLCFPVRQRAFSASGGRAAAATGAAGGFYVSYVSLYNQWDKNWSKTIVFLRFQKGSQAVFGLVSGAVPSFRATVFPCPAGCVFSTREEQQQQQQEQQEGSVSHCTNSGIKTYFPVSLYNQWDKNWSKTIVFLGFQKGRQGVFGLDFGAVPSFRATVFPCPAGCVFSFGRKSSSSNRNSRRVLCLICLIVQPVEIKTGRKLLFFQGFRRDVRQFLGSFLAAVPSFRATVFPCPAGCVFSFGRKSSSSSNRNSRRVLCLICLIVQPVGYKLVENYCFSRVSEGTLGSFWARFLAPFRPSGPLCFPVRQGAFSASGGRAAAATGAAGGFYVSLYKQQYKNWSIKYCFSTGFRRDVREFLGSISGAFRSFRATLCFPVRQGAF